MKLSDSLMLPLSSIPESGKGGVLEGKPFGIGES